jgi:hypothetical protein
MTGGTGVYKGEMGGETLVAFHRPSLPVTTRIGVIPNEAKQSEESPSCFGMFIVYRFVIFLFKKNG